MCGYLEFLLFLFSIVSLNYLIMSISFLNGCICTERREKKPKTQKHSTSNCWWWCGLVVCQTPLLYVWVFWILASTSTRGTTCTYYENARSLHNNGDLRRTSPTHFRLRFLFYGCNSIGYAMRYGKTPTNGNCRRKNWNWIEFENIGGGSDVRWKWWMPFLVCNNSQHVHTPHITTFFLLFWNRKMNYDLSVPQSAYEYQIVMDN